MAKIFMVFLLSMPLFGGSLEQLTGSISAHTEMLMDSKINPSTKSLQSNLSMQNDNLLTLSGKFWVDMDSFVSEKKDRDEHMHESIDVVNFKVATYTISNVDRGNNGSYIIDGKLDFHGVTKDLKATAKIVYENGILSIDADSMILMSEFGIEMPCMVFMCVRDKVDLKIEATFR